MRTKTAFICIGIINTIICYATFKILNVAFQLSVIESHTIAYSATIVISFTLNSIVTFKSKMTMYKLTKFVATQLLMLGISTVAIGTATDYMSTDLSWATSIVITTVINYWATKRIMTG